MTLCDASALIALINKGDANHDRCLKVLSSLSAPLITTWPCFTESMYLLGRYGSWMAQEALWGYVIDQILVLHLNSEEEQLRMRILMEQYRDVPMDLADASLVVTAESINQRKIFTLDRDFQIYRFRSNQPFEVVPQQPLFFFPITRFTPIKPIVQNFCQGVGTVGREGTIG